jgi:alpha-2-macroglobulin
VSGLMLLVAFLTGCSEAINPGTGIELVPSADPPGSTATFELRFDRPVAKAREIGAPATTSSPLVIRPPVAGAFTWLGSRSGTFTPTNALAMDCRYEFSLQPGLTYTDGTVIESRFHRTITTPPFSLIGSVPSRADTNASAIPEVKLVFNAAVQASDAQSFISFRDRRGRRVTAEARQGTEGERFSDYAMGNNILLRTWDEQFEALAFARSSSRSPDHPEEPAATNQVSNLLVVTPRQPLPLGQDWEVEIKAGLPVTHSNLRLRQAARVPLGNVTPFVLVGYRLENVIGKQPKVTLDFSKPIATRLTNLPARAINLEPRPAQLATEVASRSLVLRGDFRSGAHYTLTLGSAFPAAEPFTLGEAKVLDLELPPIAPRLYFPGFSCDQLATGSRTFSLQTVNVHKVHVRAKLMEPQTAIHALRGYRSYYRPWQERKSWDEPYRYVDYNLVPGRTVFEATLSAGEEVDVPTTQVLSWDQLLNGRKTGVVFLDAERASAGGDADEALGAQAMVQLTDLGVVWKQSPRRVDAWVFSYQTGEPLADATVRLCGDENEIFAQSVTDAQGATHLAAHTNAQWIAVEKTGDFHALPLPANQVSTYAFQLAGEWAPERDTSRRVLLFSERDLYRVGETLNLKALARVWSAEGLQIPTNLKGTLICIDARGRKFLETNAAFSATGSWSMSLPLNSESRGSYLAELHLDSEVHTYQFQVQDFQPSAFEIHLPAPNDYRADDTVKVPISARYYFGKPLSRAQVKWWLELEDSGFHPAGFDGFGFSRCEFENRFHRGAASMVISGEGTLSSTTNLVIAPEIPINPVAPQPRLASLRAEVTDLNQQTLTSAAVFHKHSSEFYLGLRATQAVFRAGAALPVEIIAVGAEGHPWPRAVSAHLKLQRVDWSATRVQGAGQVIRYHNEPVFTNLYEREIEVSPVTLPAAAEVPMKGMALTGLIADQAGQYLIEVTAADSRGHPVATSMDFVATAPARLAWDYRNETHIGLKADRKVYQGGDTARIAVEAPFAGTAWVTVEREHVARSFVAHLDGNAPVIEVPIESGDAPNTFVSVTLVRGANNSTHQYQAPEYRVGYCQLAVENPQNRLQVVVTPTATNYLPASPVELTVAIKNHSGTGVPDTEVTLYAVDEGILSLTDHEAPDPYDFFYAPHSLGVESSVSLPSLVGEDAEQLRYSNKGYLGGDGGRSEQIRHNFLACAFWHASLQTDGDGMVHAKFLAPDSLTRYRLVAIAHTRDSRFGCGQSAFQVAKPLVVEPALPRFANLSDHVLARAVVQNQTLQPGEIAVSLELDDKARSSEMMGRQLTRRIRVPANGAAIVEFPLEFVEVGTASWVWRARFSEESNNPFTDAVRSTLEVGHIAPRLREVILSRATNTQADLLAQANPQLVAGRGTITVEVSNTRLFGLGTCITELLHYPYGCAEQTGSSLLPWIVLHNSPELRDLAGRETIQMDRALQAGINRLVSMQTAEGGLGYWPHDSSPMFWASAYGGVVLAWAQASGIDVPKPEFDRLIKYLSSELRTTNTATSSPDDCCLALYALAVAGRPEPAYHEKLFSRRSQLSKEGRSLLALAIAQAQGPVEMRDELLQPGRTATPESDHDFGSATRARAIQLLAWTQHRRESPQIDILVAELMQEQKAGRWSTTQENAWALLALAEYGRRVQGIPQEAEGELRWGTQSMAYHLAGTNHFFRMELPLTGAPTNQPLTLTIAKGQVFTSVNLDAHPPVSQQPRQDRGFGLRRRYQRLNDENQAQDLAGLRVGDRVLVTLRLQVRKPARYVAVDDPLPSILEAVNPNFGNQLSGTALNSGTIADGDYWTSDFQELRTDRALFFANWVTPGDYVIQYVARVRAAGRATAPAAKAEEMYHPDRYGLCETAVLTSQPLETQP